MLTGGDRYGAETALYNLDQPVVLKMGQFPSDVLYTTGVLEDANPEAVYQAGLRRGAIEALAMMLGYDHNMNQVWQGQPLPIERGKYGRYEREES